MVSFQGMLSPKSLHHHNKTISYLDTSPRLNRPSNGKKRKSDDADHPAEPSITAFSSSIVDLHLETPLPSEWQRCLDIKSGEIHFYNTRTHKRTLKDPRASDTNKEQTPSNNMSLDLELNLPCGDHPHKRAKKSDDSNSKYNSRSGCTLSLFSSSSVVADKEQLEEEMVAAACKRCHMLVVLCKSSPACPNCKFMHPPHQPTPPLKLFKPTLSLIC